MLGIVIPTYKRNKNLLLTLNELASKLKNNKSITVYVNDDYARSNLGLNEIFKKNQFVYKKNTKRLGHDKNILKSLEIGCKHQYCWVLGDSQSINLKYFDKIIKLCQQKKHEIICVNHASRMVDLKSGLYSRNYYTYLYLLWHLTLTGTIIFKSNSIIKKIAFKKKAHRNFPLLSILINLLESYNLKLMWVNIPIILSKVKQKSYWTNNTIEVFGKDWINLLKNNISSITPAEMSVLIKSHSKNTSFFSFKNLLLINLQNLNFSKKRIYLPIVLESSHINYFLIIFAFYIPSFLIRIGMRLIIWIKK